MTEKRKIERPKEIEVINSKDKLSSKLRIIALTYSWLVIVMSPFMFLVEDYFGGITMMLKGILFVTFLENKHKWRIATLALSVLTLITSLIQIDNLYYLLDIIGNLALISYILKKEK